uniref:BTB domain-containing protein n=1 Tax=Strigamia maritima TaxID=126957 RepID=T1ITG2_STRMM
MDKRLSSTAIKMEELRQQQICTDIAMHCEGGVVLAHQCVLIASCPYFEKMFTIDMSEKNTGCVNFKSISKNVIETIVKYLYTAQMPTLDDDFSFSRQLISTSHTMELQDLLINCWKQITNNLNAEKFARLWAVAIEFDLEKEGSIEKYAKNNMKEISEKANVHDLTQIQITRLIQSVDQKQFCNECVRCILKWNSNCSVIREEISVQLLQKLDLSHLDDVTLYHLLQNFRSNEKKETIENVLTREAVSRLPKTPKGQKPTSTPGKATAQRRVTSTYPIKPQFNFPSGSNVAPNRTDLSSSECRTN